MRVWTLAAVVASIVLSGAAFGQAKTDEPVERRWCASAGRTGRRIVSEYGLVEFRVPIFATLKKTRDVDYVVYGVGHGSGTGKVLLSFSGNEWSGVGRMVGCGGTLSFLSTDPGDMKPNPFVADGFEIGD